MVIRSRQIESWQKTMITVCRGYSLGGRRGAGPFDSGLDGDVILTLLWASSQS